MGIDIRLIAPHATLRCRGRVISDGGEVTLGILAALALLGGVAFYGALRMSLPLLEGGLALPGLTAPVRIERDDLGVPTISAANQRDRARALGVLHAQDRFFQMDLLRRTAAGELAELFGEPAVAMDRGKRLHRFRARAHDALSNLPADDRVVLDAYVDGVNHGLSSLGSRPFEYWLLRTDPVLWRPEDSLLVVYAMYLNLQDDLAARDNTIELLRRLVGEQALAFFVPARTAWDASLDDAVGAVAAAPIPAVTWPTGDLAAGGAEGVDDKTFAVGSNNFAVGGALTATGAGIVAGDMHLELRVPNIWYRASWWLNDQGGHRVTGVTLPGVPVMVAGSNGRVAWTFTNSYLDVSDLLLLEWATEQPGAFRTPDGAAEFQYHDEVIAVRGAPNATLLVAQTPWGPLLDADEEGHYRVVRWMAHDRRAVDLSLLQMEKANTVEAALDVATAAGIPAQNIVVADAHGRLGWSVAGRVPDRAGPSVVGVERANDSSRAWRGVLPAHAHPRRIDPASARLWTANNRVIDDTDLDRVGDGGYKFGARARQIRDGLYALQMNVTESQLLDIQLDERALLLGRWQALLLRVLDERALAQHPKRAELRAIVEQWNGRAAVDSAAYRMVRAFRTYAADKIFGALFVVAQRQDARFNYRTAAQWEEPLWHLIEQRTSTGLAPGFRTWDEQLLTVVDEVVRYFEQDGKALAQQTWGARNTLAMHHPFAKVVPRLKGWLGMPAQPLPGDVDTPRVQGVDFGASQRMVVSPGHEQSGLFHMPGGQSGHPLSPFYRAGHEAWVQGAPTAFLPGATRHELRLFNP